MSRLSLTLCSSISTPKYKSEDYEPESLKVMMASLDRHLNIGVRAGGASGAAAPPNFGQCRFFGQQEKIWAKPVFKDVSMFLLLF